MGASGLNLSDCFLQIVRAELSLFGYAFSMQKKYLYCFTDKLNGSKPGFQIFTKISRQPFFIFYTLLIISLLSLLKISF